MYQYEPRVLEIERRINGLEYQVADLAAKVNELLQQLPRAWGQPSSDGGTPTPVYWCVGDGTAHVATGTWPSLTVPTFTSDVYKLVGGTLTLVGSGKTIHWPYKDAMSATSGKLIPCAPNPDGTSYDAIEESCTVVT